MLKTDVLVIGGGLAGKRCAQVAGEVCDVLLLADGAGASPFIHGINVPLHPDDSAELFYADTLNSGKGQGKPELIRVLCEESRQLADEFSFTKNENGYDLLKPLGSSLPRVAGIDGRTGAKILHGIDKNRKFRQLSGVRALRLLTENGRVCGAVCFDKNAQKWFAIAAKAVVLATGGFSGIFPFSTNSSDIGGDGVAMAYEAGARLCDMEFIQFEPTAAPFPEKIRGKSIITTMLYEGAVIRNKNGERFMEEKVNKDELSLGIYREILRGNATAHDGVFYDMTGVSPALLHGKYRDYADRYLACGIDVCRQPVEIAPAPHTTLGGVAVNEKCETTLPGLFACGEVTGGLHGANRLGGNAGLEVLVFGKIAGESASRYALAAPAVEEISVPEATEEPLAPSDLSEEKRALSLAVQNGLNVIRCDAGLAEVIGVSTRIREKCRTHPGSYEAARLYNDATAVLTAALCARERQESIGCHVRSDSAPERGKYRLTIRQDGDVPAVEREEIP